MLRMKKLLVVFSMLILSACQENEDVKFTVNIDKFTDKVKSATLSFTSKSSDYSQFIIIKCFNDGGILLQNGIGQYGVVEHNNTASQLKFRVDKMDYITLEGNFRLINNSVISLDFWLSEKSLNALLSDLTSGKSLKTSASFYSLGSNISYDANYKVQNSSSKIIDFKKHCGIQ